MTTRKWARPFTAAAVVAGTLFASTASAATASDRCPADQSCVAVIVGGAVAETFSSSEIEAGDIQNGPVYQVREAHGTTCSDSDPIASGSSIYSLLSQSAVSLAANGHVEVSSPGVAGFDLTEQQVSADGGGDFYNGQIPVIYGNGTSSSLAFIRGLLASPAPCPPAGPKPGADSNAGAQGDFFGVTEIDLTVYGGPTLDVTIAPSPTHTPTGNGVAFTAKVAGDGSATYVYHWTFGDGGGVTTAVDHVTYPYDVAGTYVAQVTVDGSDGSTGISDPDTVTVGGKPATGGTTSTGGGQSPAPGPSTGPTAGNGQRSGAPATGRHTGVDTHSAARVPQSSAQHRNITAASATEVTGQLLGKPSRFIALTDSDSTPVVAGSAPAATAASGDSPLALSCGIAIAALLVAAGAARELRTRRR